MSNTQEAREERAQTGPGSAGKPFIYSVDAKSNDEVEIDLGELLAALLHWAWLIILVGLACGIAGYLGSRFLIAEEFESTTKIYVLDKSDSSTSTYTELQTGSQLTNDYAEIITSRAVLEQVMADNNLLSVYTYDSFAAKVDVDVPDSTRIVAITVTDTDPALAQKLADEIRIAASELIVETMQIDAVNTFEEANYPTEKSAPSNTRNALIAALIGAVLVAAVVVIRYLLDDTVKTSEDIERYLRLSTLALIPLDENIGAEGTRRKRRRAGPQSKSSSGGDGSSPRRRIGARGGGVPAPSESEPEAAGAGSSAAPEAAAGTEKAPAPGGAAEETAGETAEAKQQKTAAADTVRQERQRRSRPAPAESAQTAQQSDAHPARRTRAAQTPTRSGFQPGYVSSRYSYYVESIDEWAEDDPSTGDEEEMTPASETTSVGMTPAPAADTDTAQAPAGSAQPAPAQDNAPAPEPSAPAQDTQGRRSADAEADSQG